jgi:lipoprotein signal peptidase
MTERSYRGWFVGLAVSGFVLDQLTKYGVFRWLYNDGFGGEYTVVPNAFDILAQYKMPPESFPAGPLSALQVWSGPGQPRVNEGALFGLLGQLGVSANFFFAVVSMVAAVAILLWASRRSAGRDGALCVALGLILGGTLGNLYDRLVFGGVRDFLYWHWKDDFRWPVFNIADCCLVFGAGLLLLQALFAKPAAKPADSPDEAKTSEAATA